LGVEEVSKTGDFPYWQEHHAARYHFDITSTCQQEGAPNEEDFCRDHRCFNRSNFRIRFRPQWPYRFQRLPSQSQDRRLPLPLSIDAVPRLGGVLGFVAGLHTVEVSKTPNRPEGNDVLEVVRRQVRVAHGHVQRGMPRTFCRVRMLPPFIMKWDAKVCRSTCVFCPAGNVSPDMLTA
jgi:hypothetical protein